MDQHKNHLIKYIKNCYNCKYFVFASFGHAETDIFARAYQSKREVNKNARQIFHDCKIF